MFELFRSCRLFLINSVLPIASVIMIEEVLPRSLSIPRRWTAVDATAPGLASSFKGEALWATHGVGIIDATNSLAPYLYDHPQNPVLMPLLPLPRGLQLQVTRCMVAAGTFEFGLRDWGGIFAVA